MGYLIYAIIAIPVVALASFVTGPLICMIGVYAIFLCISPFALVAWPFFRSRRRWDDYWTDVFMWGTCLAVGLSFVIHLWLPAWLICRKHHLSPWIFSCFATVVIWYGLRQAPPWANLVGAKFYVSMLVGWIVTIMLIATTFN